MNGISRPRSRNRRSDEPSLTLVRDRRAHGHARSGPRPPVQKLIGRRAGREHLLERLEAENAELRDRAVALALQILVLRDAARS